MLVDGLLITAPPLDRVAPGPAGVRLYARGRSHRGYTLFSPGMGNIVCLVDDAGIIVHWWAVERTHLAQLLPGGNVLVDTYGEHGGLRELNPQGGCVWQWEGPYHHDFDLCPDGRIVLLISRKEPAMRDFFASDETPQAIFNDIVIEMDRQGRVLWQFSLAAHVSEMIELAGLPEPVRYAIKTPDNSVVVVRQPDWAHTNTVEVLPQTPLGLRDPRFRAGNILFSCRALDLIGVIDRQQEKVVWAWGPGTLDGQHQPTMLPNGHLLMFDNGTYRGYSVVREIAPESGVQVWEYSAPGGFFSPYRSGVQRLGNGNTLICESDAGRIFEVTPQGEIVWDYYSPFWGTNAGNEGRHVYRATRYTEEDVISLFSQKPGPSAVGKERRITVKSFGEALAHYEAGFLGQSWKVVQERSGIGL